MELAPEHGARGGTGHGLRRGRHRACGYDPRNPSRSYDPTGGALSLLRNDHPRGARTTLDLGLSAFVHSRSQPAAALAKPART